VEILLLVVIVGAVPALIALGSIFLLIKRRLYLMVAFLSLLLIGGIAASVYIVFGIGTFLLGGALSCLTIPAAVVALIVFIGGRASFFRRFKEDKLRGRLYLASCLLVPFLILIPCFGPIAITSMCFELNRQTGNTIVTALEAYKQDHGTYPEELEDLVPTYLPAIPPARCVPLSPPPSNEKPGAILYPLYQKPKFALQRCHTGETVLTVPIATGEWIQRCNLATGNWARVSFLDGACSYLK
jgi:hypothetical protein